MSKFHKWCLVLLIVVTIFAYGIKCDDDCDDPADDSPNSNGNNNGKPSSTKSDDSKSGGPIGETAIDIIEGIEKTIKFHLTSLINNLRLDLLDLHPTTFGFYLFEATFDGANFQDKTVTQFPRFPASNIAIGDGDRIL
ncbi:hypothetical protein CEXT_800581 [Caerostris extrusa]|uniref:Uncharacterized protein n=1 Tax=Caerostris extrusa TaxID=172846 RepID=A0AAV4M820_CAEEX|nr:hypothetical protein CEXT_800581 [Caerostris extrusa]